MEDAEEQTRYDRQIRLWGLEAQKRMRDSRILVVHLSGLAVEVVKNLVLAGVGKVHVLDDRQVVPQDLAVNFFLEAGDVGLLRATAACERIRALNPLVQITCEAASIEDKEDAFWTSFDVVCLTQCPLSFQRRINRLVRTGSTAFFGCNSFGMLSMMFADLGDHFVYTAKTGEVTEEFTAEFVNLDSVWECNNWKAKRPSQSLLACQLLLCTQENNTSPDAQQLRELRSQLAAKHGFDAAALSDQYIARLVAQGHGEISPVCTVVGGVVAQEILKVAQRNVAPFNNIFVYDALDPDLKGIVERLP